LLEPRPINEHWNILPILICYTKVTFFGASYANSSFRLAISATKMKQHYNATVQQYRSFNVIYFYVKGNVYDLTYHCMLMPHSACAFAGFQH